MSGSTDHPRLAAEFLADAERTTWHDRALWHVREKRDGAAGGVPEWELLRDQAAAIKRHTLSHLDEYLAEFERNATQNGAKVHWARDAEEHNTIVLSLLRSRGIDRIVKSKSMLTEECELNDYLGQRGVRVVDTDLGEWIIQLADERPSHIVMPAIHKKKEEVGAVFHEHLGTEAGANDPEYLTGEARKRLRQEFLSATGAISGVNFAAADNGTVVVCTNEGNADLGIHLADIHIASMGIEKVIPRFVDLGVFTRLLARSATGQPVTTYTSHFQRPRRGSEFHIVLVDNGRTRQLSREDFRDSLACIRCGACMNTCPIYRRSGGHSYGTTIPGPIGAILSPGIDLRKHASLPFASTLCGSCSDVCPVKINIHEQLYAWRQVVVESGKSTGLQRRLARSSAGALSNPRRYRALGKWIRRLMRTAPGFALRNRMNVWARKRELPRAPRQSFNEWYRENRSDK